MSDVSLDNLNQTITSISNINDLTSRQGLLKGPLRCLTANTIAHDRKKRNTRKPRHFFITFTCYQWLSLFSETNSYDLVYNWFDVLIKKGNQIGGYVIMPNHVHALIALNQSSQSINKIVANGKRFIAYELIERLKQQGHLNTLELLKSGVSKTEQKKGQLHKVFEESFDVKICESHAFMEQKLDYMHTNPCSKKWMLSEDPIDYEHSSMGFYNRDDENIRLTPYTQLLEAV